MPTDFESGSYGGSRRFQDALKEVLAWQENRQMSKCADLLPKYSGSILEEALPGWKQRFLGRLRTVSYRMKDSPSGRQGMEETF